MCRLRRGGGHAPGWRDHREGDPISDVIVVGAGVAGLGAAYRLQQQGFDVQVLEAEPHVGGRTKATRRDGFTLNTAATILSGSYDNLFSLTKELGLPGEFKKVTPPVGIAVGGEVHWLRGAGLGAVTDFVRTRLLKPKSKLLLARAGLDAFKVRKQASFDRPELRAAVDTESVEAYCERRLNRDVLDRLFEPLMGSLFLVDGRGVSVAELYFSLAKFLGGGMVSYPNGIDALCRGLAERVPVELEARVSLIEEVDGAARVVWTKDGAEHDERVAGVVCTLPGSLVPGIHPGLEPEIQAILLEGILPADFICYRFALDRVPDVAGLLVAVTEHEFGGIGTVILEHNISSDAAPPGKGVVAVLCYHGWSTQRMEKSDDELISELLPDLDRIVPGVADMVEFCDVTRWKPGSVWSRPGMHKLIAEVDRRVDDYRRVQLAGDYMTVASVNGCLMTGELAAKRLGAASGREADHPRHRRRRRRHHRPDRRLPAPAARPRRHGPRGLRPRRGPRSGRISRRRPRIALQGPPPGSREGWSLQRHG